MSINLDVVVETTEDTIDMKTGLDTFQGVSDATRTIAETLLTEKVPKRNSHKSKVRTELKRSFKGSYGQIFSLEIYDIQAKKNLNRMTQPVFVELLAYFFAESLYREPKALSQKAQTIYEKLGDKAEDLVSQLRVSALENIHEISTKFDHDVRIRFRKNRDNITELSRFTRETSKVLQAKETKEEIDLEVSITRLNIHTGNGRLQLKGASETIAFGFNSAYKNIRLSAKKVFSENLDHNNGLQQEKWSYLKLVGSPVRLNDGTIVKFFIKAIRRD